jgi:allantoicase
MIKSYKETKVKEGWVVVIHKQEQKQEQKHKYAISRVSRRDRVNDITLALFPKR